MITFLFKKNKIVLDCFTDLPHVFYYAPIKKAMHFIPSWWKDLPKSEVTINERLPFLNMRYCPGIVDFYKRGFIIPMWSELKIVVDSVGSPDYQWQYADRVSHIDVHDLKQWGKFLDPAVYQHFKLATPWTVKSNKDVYFSFMYPTWNFKNPEELIVFNGVDNYYHQHSTTINLVLKREAQAKQVFINHNQPLVHIAPFSERELDLRLHLVTEEENKKLKSNQNLFFINNYFKQRKLTLNKH